MQFLMIRILEKIKKKYTYYFKLFFLIFLMEIYYKNNIVLTCLPISIPGELKLFTLPKFSSQFHN